MLSEIIPYDQVLRKHTVSDRAYRAVLDLLRKKLGVTIGYDARLLPLGDPALIEGIAFGELLLKHRVITSYYPGADMADEMRCFIWTAVCNESTEHQTAGASFESNDKALMAALAEALERYIWLTQDDYFSHPTIATEKEIAHKGTHIAPARWVGFSDAQRAADPRKQLHADARYLWVRTRSLVSGRTVYAPAQIMSGKYGRERRMHKEPIIRYTNTNGLATWPTRIGAQIAGISELVEREAYMIMWLNQLTLPRIDLAARAESDPLLASMLKRCKQYRLKVHAVRMLTDAPVHTVYVIFEDESGMAPRFTIGLNAHRSLNRALLKAMTEALRPRRGYRKYFANGKTWDPATPVDTIGHRERLYHWGAHAEALEFLTQGPIESVAIAEWEHEDDETYFARLRAWCAAENLECVSMSLNSSKKNPTKLFIEMVAMPDLQPTYLREAERTFGGTRLRSIPEKFGYTPRTEAFTKHPHPFS